MKAILEFDLPEERSEFRDAMSGGSAIGSLEELDNWLRGKEKYDDKENIDISDVRDMIFEIASDKGIRLFEN